MVKNLMKKKKDLWHEKRKIILKMITSSQKAGHIRHDDEKDCQREAKEKNNVKKKYSKKNTKKMILIFGVFFI